MTREEFIKQQQGSMVGYKPIAENAPSYQQYMNTLPSKKMGMVSGGPPTSELGGFGPDMAGVAVPEMAADSSAMSAASPYLGAAKVATDVVGGAMNIWGSYREQKRAEREEKRRRAEEKRRQAIENRARKQALKDQQMQKIRNYSAFEKYNTQSSGDEWLRRQY